MAELKRKYGTTVSEMLSTLTGLQKEFSELGSLSSRLDEIHSEIARSEEVIKELARALSKARATAAKLFAKTVTDELKDLKMSEAKFEIECVALSELKDFAVTGADAVQFLVQTNRGEPERALGKIASGGELSRLMLAIRRVIADRGGIGVYLFDEIDAGIGGQTAFEVGKKLKSVAAFNQVICITHLPQVASFAHHHLSVVKRTLKDRTVTEVIELTGSMRKEELARMLGGPSLSARSLENAAELLEVAAR
jgi:DNA repair protein RecN (Recombination protein N)